MWSSSSFGGPPSSSRSPPRVASRRPRSKRGLYRGVRVKNYPPPHDREGEIPPRARPGWEIGELEQHSVQIHRTGAARGTCREEETQKRKLRVALFHRARTR